MNSGVILGIVVTIIMGILGIISGIIATLWPSEFKERIRKLWDLFKSPQSSFAKIKYTIIISVLGVFLCVAIILACTGDFDLWIFHIIGFWSLCFISLLGTEQTSEKGDKYTQTS